MNQRAQTRVAVVGGILLLSLLGFGLTLAGSTVAQTADITVDADGSANFTSIQAAVDNATAGEVIEVRNGTYRESVRVNESILLVAGSGEVVLNGSTLSAGDAITITDSSTVQPMVSGFSITGYDNAVDAQGTAGDWAVENLTITNTTSGISAFNSSGNWNVGNVTVTGGSVGINASASSGGWSIGTSIVRNPSDAGIAVMESTGNGTVFQSTVSNGSAGIEADTSAGNWSVYESTFENNIIGVSAIDTSGEWVIEQSRIHNNSVEGLNASGAAIMGDASYNYWGTSDGPSGPFNGSGDGVFGNVDISPYYTDETLTNLSQELSDTYPAVNATASSVTPTNATTNESQSYTVDVTIENTSLTTESGEVDVDFENFTLDTLEPDLTINYSSSNISNGTLSVTGSVNAMAPDLAGTYAVNLTEIRVDGAAEGPVENGNLAIDTIGVSKAAEPVVNGNLSSVTPAIAQPSESKEYRVNVSIGNMSVTDEPGEVDLRFKNFTHDTGDNDLTINYTTSDFTNSILNFTGSVNATAPAATGVYDVNVTGLRAENISEPLVQNANITVATITVVDLTWSGSGTKADPYIVTNVSELQEIKYDSDAYYELANDINASETATWNSGKGFVPLGDVTNINHTPDWNNIFAGKFNGNNYSISHLTINRPQEEDVGLFGSLIGTVRNVSLVDVNVSGSLRTGGLVARNGGEIHNVRITGAVSGTNRVGGLAGRNEHSGGNVTDVSSNVSVDGETNVGGLIGYSNSLVKNASAHGPVNGTEEIGGLVGSESAGGTESMENVLATGSVNGTFEVGGLKGVSWRATHNATASGSVNGTERVGGLIGVAHNDLINTYATGSVTGSDEVGGLVGSNGVYSAYDHHINASFATGTVTGSTNIGGLVGINFANVADSYWDAEATEQQSSDGGTGLTTSQMIGDSAPSYMTGLDFTGTWETRANGYPALAVLADGTQDTTVVDPVVNTTASAVTPINATANQTQEYTVDVTIDNTNLTTESGDLDVTFKNFTLATGDDLTINYTGSNITNGTLSVSESVTATAPEFGGVYPVNVTDLRVENTSESLLSNANITIGAISVAEPVGPTVDVTASSVTPTNTTTNESQLYTVNVTVDNTTLVDQHGEVDVRFENFTLPTGDDLTINYTISNITDGTLNVSESVTATAPPEAGVYPVNVTDLRVENISESLFSNANITIGAVSVAEPVGPTVDVTASSVTPTNATANESQPYTVNVTIENTSLTDQHGEVDVAFENFTFATGDDLTINYTGSNITDGTLNVSESVTATAPAESGVYDVNVTDLRIENTSESLFGNANITIGVIGVSEPVGPTINYTASSVTPTSTIVNESQPYTVNVTVDNTTLTDQHGEVDVRFKNFTVGTGDDLTINYTGSNITDGTLSVSESVTATAPAEPGVYDINVTDLRVENTSESLFGNANITIGAIGVGEPAEAEPTINYTASSVTPTSTLINESQLYTVNFTIENTSLTNESGGVDVAVENFTLETGDDLTINYTASNITNGTLSVSESVTATAPVEPGVYDVNVTDLRIENSEPLFADVNITIGAIGVGEPAEPATPSVNTTASSVTPTTVTVNQSTIYELGVTVENTSLANHSGALGVRFNNFSVDSTADDTTLNFTSSNITNGTISVSESVTATAPAESGVYDVNVTWLQVDNLSDGEDSMSMAVNTTIAAITVTSSQPNASDDRYSVTTGDTLSVSEPGVLGNDSHPTDANLTASVVSEPTNGTLSLSTNGGFTYTPDAGYVGDDSFEYQANATSGGTDTATVTIFVNEAAAESIAASLADSTITAGQNTSLSVTALLSDGTTLDVTSEATLSSGDESIARVDDTGAVTSVSGGSTTLTATFDGLTATADLTVETPPLTVDRSTVDFGNVSTTSSATEPVTVTNDAPTAIQIDSATLSGTDADQFRVNASAITGEIPADTVRTVGVTYAPSATGAASATLDITASQSSLSPPSVSLTGTGTDTSTQLTITANRTSIVSGEPVRFTVTDSEGSPVDAATVSVLNRAGQTGADGNVTLRIDTVGELTATAEKASDSTTYRSDTLLIVVEEATLDVGQSAIDFGSVPLGTVGSDRITLVNDAQTSVDVGSVEIGGTNAGVFNIESPPATVPAETNYTLNVSFEPDIRGVAAARVEIGAESVRLTGNGVAPTVDVTSELPIELTVEQPGTDNATVDIANDGNASLNATLTTADERFSHPDGISVEAGSSGSIELQFDPEASDSGTVSTGLTITPESAAVEPVTVPVVGTVTDRHVDLRRPAVAFGNTTVGEPTTRAIVVDNLGTTTEELAVTTTEAEFGLVDSEDESITLAPGESERLALEATLSEPGQLTASLNVENESTTDVGDTAVLNASGRAPRLNVVESGPLTFSATPINSTSTETIEFENTGSATLSVSLTDAFNSTEQATFGVVGETSFEIPAGESRTATVGFRPRAAGNTTADLTFTTNDVTAPQETVRLEAEGLETDLQIADGLAGFGAVGVNSSEIGSLTIENNGGSQLDLRYETTSDTEFTVESGPSTLDGGERVDIEVRFTPTAAGIRTGELTITGQNPTSGDSVTVSTPLTGDGRYAEMTVGQPSLRTGVTRAGGTTTGSVTVANTGINGTTLTIEAIDSTNSAFSLASDSLAEGDVLVGGERDSLAVTFDSEADAENGQQEATLRLNVSNGGETISRLIPVTAIVTAPEPAISTEQLSVGTVDVGKTIGETVTVSNDGGEPFNITDVTAGEGVDARVIGLNEVFPGSETTVALGISRNTTGSFATDLEVETDVGETLSTTVTGNAVAPELTVSTEEVTFGTTPVGSASQAEVTIRNTGNASLTVARPTITDDTDSYRILSGDRRLRIAPGGSQNVSLGFGPTSAAPADAMLRIEPLNVPSDSGQTENISLSGTGEAAVAALNESAVGFGDVARNETVTRSLTITNDGETPLTITGSSLLGADSGAFSVSGLDPSVLDGNESEQFTVELDTTGISRGGLNSQLVITTDDTDVTSYLGATVVEPDIAVASGVDAGGFGPTKLGETSVGTVAIENTGNAELQLTDLSVTGADADAFNIDTPDGTTVDAQDTARIAVVFDPAAAPNAVSRAQNTPLEATATLSVSSNDPDSDEQSVAVALNGRATTPALDVRRTFRFGETPIGETTSGTIEIENTPSATVPLDITAVHVNGRDASDYTATLDEPMPAPLAPGESTTMTVNITPSSFGQKYAALSVETSDTRQPVRKVGLSNTETVYSVTYGSVHVDYIEPTEGTEPTVDVNEGLRGRNATLQSVNSNVSTTEDYGLSYTFGTDPAAVGHSTALQEDTATGLDAIALQYMNATTTADADNFTESTIQVEVSKATLASQGVTPENVSIYHENGDSYDRLETELLFETTQGYVYETTVHSYSVFAVGYLQESSDDGTDGGDGDDGTDGGDGDDGTDGGDGDDGTDGGDGDDGTDGGDGDDGTDGGDGDDGTDGGDGDDGTGGGNGDDGTGGGNGSNGTDGDDSIDETDGDDGDNDSTVDDDNTDNTSSPDENTSTSGVDTGETGDSQQSEMTDDDAGGSSSVPLAVGVVILIALVGAALMVRRRGV